MAKRVREYELRISAVLAKGGSAVMQDLNAASERTRAKITSDAQTGQRAMQQAARAGGESWAKEFDQGTAKATRALQSAMKSADAASAALAAREVARANATAQAKVRADMKAFDERLRASARAAAQEQRQYAAMKRTMEREREKENREIVRDAARIERQEARAAEKDEKGRRGTVREVAGGAYANMAGVARGAMGVGKEIAGGLGVHFDLSSAVANRAGLQSQIVDLMNQSRLGGKTLPKSDRARLTGLVDKVSDENALDPTKTVRVLAEMQAKSSDLEGAEKVIGDLGKLAAATGTDMGDMGKAAGIVNSQLVNMAEYKDDAAKRGTVLLNIMRHITKQTADGSVEMSDYAVQMGRIASVAGKYEGSFEDNIGMLGAMSQVAMRGGAVSAAEAARAAASLSRDLTKEKTLKNWNNAEGGPMDIFSDDKKTKLKPVDQLVLMYLEKFGADQAKLAHFIPNEMSRKGFQGFMNIFQDAGGGKAGLDAVKAEFAKFKGTVSQDEVNSMAADKLDTPQAKAQKFQNQLERIADGMTAKVMPALEALAPRALEVADALAKMVGFAAENPGTAITMAIVGSIAKAGITTAVSKGLGDLLASAGSKVGGINIAAATMGIAVGTLIAAKMNDEQHKGGDEAKQALDMHENIIKTMEDKVKRGEKLSPDDIDVLQKEREKIVADQTKGREKTGVLDALNPFSDKGFKDIGKEQMLSSTQGTLSNELKGIDALIAAQSNGSNAVVAALGGTLNVNVANMPSAGMIPGDGRPSQ
jgi:hypothetical protein